MTQPVNGKYVKYIYYDVAFNEYRIIGLPGYQCNNCEYRGFSPDCAGGPLTECHRTATPGEIIDYTEGRIKLIHYNMIVDLMSENVKNSLNINDISKAIKN